MLSLSDKRLTSRLPINKFWIVTGSVWQERKGERKKIDLAVPYRNAKPGPEMTQNKRDDKVGSQSIPRGDVCYYHTFLLQKTTKKPALVKLILNFSYCVSLFIILHTCLYFLTFF